MASAPMVTPPTPAPAAPPPAKKSWMPLTAGILSIVAGASNLCVGLVALALSTRWERFEFRHAFRAEALGAFGIIWIILAIVSIIGGAFALRKKVWGLALAGAICALIWPTTVLGIVAIVFVALSKEEFK
jgi:hypothetical protein